MNYVLQISAILFNSAEAFEQIVNTPSKESLMWNLVKISQRKRHLKITQFYVYSPEERADIPQGDSTLNVTQRF